MNQMGRRIDTCGTPNLVSCISDLLLFETYCFLPLMYDLNHIIVFV